ncbi:hypothetical protein GCM10020256_56110 [Streptomyces thermocoprophilus]
MDRTVSVKISTATGSIAAASASPPYGGEQRFPRTRPHLAAVLRVGVHAASLPEARAAVTGVSPPVGGGARYTSVRALVRALVRA